MKLAYWPGCVSRGFTPELHGSMAAVAPKLGREAARDAARPVGDLHYSSPSSPMM